MINHHLFHNPVICAWMNILEVFLYWICFTFIFVGLYKLLKRYHSFEFELRSKHMISFFIMIFVIYLIKGIEQVIIVYCYGSYVGQDDNQTDYCSKHIIDTAVGPSVLVIFFFCVPQLLIGIAIWTFKDLYDPISGVSKLDNLYLISCF